MSDEYDLILEFERDCDYFAAPIRKKICKRILRALNKKYKDVKKHDFNFASLSYVDKISILYQHYPVDEIDYGFENRIIRMIDEECKKASPIERHFLFYSECSGQFVNESIDYQDKIFEELCIMIEEHYFTYKVQRYIDTHSWP